MIRNHTSLTPYLFDDLPVWPAENAAAAGRVVAVFGPLLAEEALPAALTGLFNECCKVKQLPAPELEVKKGALESRQVRVDPLPFTMGRKSGNQLVLSEAGVSGLHARIRAEGDRLVIEDPGSVNGTFLNGKRLEKQTAYTLKPGDVITVMGTEMVFRQPEPVLGSPRLDYRITRLESQLPSLRKDSATARLGLTGTGRFLELEVDLPLLRAWLESLAGARYSVSILPARLSEMEAGLWEYLILKFLETFHRLCLSGRQAFFLAGLETGGCSSGIGALFEFRFENQTGEILLRLPALTPEEAANCGLTGGTAGFSSRREAWQWVKTPLTVAAGHTSLSPAELISLEPGDVVLFSSGGLSLSPEGELAGPALIQPAGCALFRGNGWLEAGPEPRFKLTNWIHQEAEIGMSNTNQVPKAQPAGDEAARESLPADLLKDLTLEVVIELERIRLSLEELSNLSPGQLLPLKRQASDPVTLSVDGMPVGRGQLVKIDQELGVQITSMKKQAL